jgi:hypothetical protein
MGNVNSGDPVVRWTNFHGAVSRARATLKIVLRLGPWMPRSRSLMNVRSKPLFLCKSICDMCAFSRISLIACPNALSGPERG